MQIQEEIQQEDNQDDRQLQECEICDCEGEHCCECGEELTKNQCKEQAGFCERCGWLLS